MGSTVPHVVVISTKSTFKLGAFFAESMREACELALDEWATVIGSPNLVGEEADGLLSEYSIYGTIGKKKKAAKSEVIVIGVSTSPLEDSDEEGESSKAWIGVAELGGWAKPDPSFIRSKTPIAAMSILRDYFEVSSVDPDEIEERDQMYRSSISSVQSQGVFGRDGKGSVWVAPAQFINPKRRGSFNLDFWQ